MGSMRDTLSRLAVVTLAAVAASVGVGAADGAEGTGSTSAAAAFPSTRGLILFERDGNFFTTKPNGTGVRRPRTFNATWIWRLTANCLLTLTEHAYERRGSM